MRHRSDSDFRDESLHWVSLRSGMKAPFLSAEWRHLVMLNYEADPAVLKPLVPAGLELDQFRSRTFVSVVGFQFLKTRVVGCSIPFHSNFEEVNLRFYVRHTAADGWRRGVVFVRELVPRRAIASIARIIYGEPYVALPMRHTITTNGQELHVRYEWRREGVWESLAATAEGASQSFADGSLEEFITEHYWGYTARDGKCSEYQVEHPRWQIWRASKATLVADVAMLYGEPFVESLSGLPASAFIADGSSVVVRRASQLPAPYPRE